MLKIFIFSFNRGSFLKSCIDSIQRYAPTCPITVVDDNSTDKETIDFLASLPESIKLIQQVDKEDARHGGLYNNMQRAVEVSTESDLILFIQDDMQIVRPLDEADFQYIDEFYSTFPHSAFLNPVFLKGQRNRRDKRITRIYDNFPGYYRHYPAKKNSRGLSYADAVIAHAGRLKAAEWKFSAGEVKNAQNAKDLFGDMGFMAHPFMMFLPQVPVYRGKKKSWAVSKAEKLSGEEPKEFAVQDATHWKKFKERPLTELPVAENFLKTEDPDVKIPFQYSAINVYPLLKVFHKLSLWLNK